MTQKRLRYNDLGYVNIMIERGWGSTLCGKVREIKKKIFLNVTARQRWSRLF